MTKTKNKVIPIIFGLVLVFAFIFSMQMSAVAATSDSPLPPDNIYAENISVGLVYLTWDGVDDADGYVVSRYDLDNDEYVFVGKTQECSYMESNLVSGVDYYYCIQSYKGTKTGPYSNIVPVSTVSHNIIATYWTNKEAVCAGSGYYLSSGSLYDAATKKIVKQTVDLNSSFNVLSNSDLKLSRTGYTFGGWYLYAKDSGGTNRYAKVTYKGGDVVDPQKISNALINYYDSVSYQPKGNINIAEGDVTILLSAKWIANTYKVTYSGISGINNASAMTPTTYKYGTGIAVLPTPVKVGYDFLGWFTSSTGGEKVTSISATDSGNKTLYARFAPVVYTIVYKVDGNEVGSQTVNYADSVTLLKHSVANRHITDWELVSGSAITKYAQGSKLPAPLTNKSGDVILNAKTYVRILYTAGLETYVGTTGYRFIKNGSDTRSYLYNANKKLVEYYLYNNTAMPRNKIVTASTSGMHAVKAEQYWDAWNTKQDKSGTAISYNASGTYSFATIANAANANGNVALYIQFKPLSVKITCDKNGGTGGTSLFYEQYNSKFYTDTANKTQITKITPPTRTGYSFAGYYITNSDKTETQVVDKTGKITASNKKWISATTIKAKWTVIDYSVSYKWTDGTTISEQPSTVRTYGVNYLLPAVPKASGYVVDGWYSDISCTQPIETIGANVTKNVTVYAKRVDANLKYKVVYVIDDFVNPALTQTCSFGVTYQTPDQEKVNATYHFTEWNTKNDGSGTTFGFKQSFKNLTENNGEVIYLYSHKENNSVNLTLKKDNKNWAPAQSDNMSLRLVLKTYTSVTRDFVLTGKTGIYKIDSVPNGTYLVYAPLTKGGSNTSTEKYLGEIVVDYNNVDVTLNYYSVTVKKGANIASVSGGIGWIIKGGSRNLNCTVNTGYHFTNWTGTTTSTTQALKLSNISKPYTLTANTAANTYHVCYTIDGVDRPELTQTLTYNQSDKLLNYANILKENGINRKVTIWYPTRSSTGTLSGTPNYAQGATVLNLTAKNNDTIRLYAKTYIVVRYSANTESYSGTVMASNFSTTPLYKFQKIPSGSTYTYLYKHNNKVDDPKYNIYEVRVYAEGYYARKNFMTASAAGISNHKPGYTFNGWGTNSNGSGKAFSYNASGSYAFDVFALYANANGYVILYTNWIGNTSTLKVDPNGGKWNGVATIQTFQQKYPTTKSIPVPTTGPKVTLSLNANGGNTTQNTVTAVRPFTAWTKTGTNGTMSTLTAAATYTFGKTKDATDTLTANYGSVSLTIPTTKPTRTGYTFRGWAETTTVTSSTKIYQAGESLTLTANKTLYAVWKAKIYIISYKYSDWTTASVSGPKTGSYETTISLPAVPAKSGYTVEGWYLDPSCTGDKISNVTITGNLVLYAKLTKK